MIEDYSVYKLLGKEKWLFYMAGYSCIFVVVYLFYHSVILSLLSGVLVKLFQPYAEKYLAARRMSRLNMQFKDMLYSLSASVAAGRHMEEALVEAEENLSLMYGENEPIMKELRHIKVNIVDNKESDKPLLIDLASRTKNEDIDNFVQVYITCRNMGGDLEKIIMDTSLALTEKMNIEREIKVITNQKKTEGRIISAMPLAMLLLMNLFSYTYISPLYNTLGGRIVMTIAIAGMVAGLYLMERISEIKI